MSEYSYRSEYEAGDIATPALVLRIEGMRTWPVEWYETLALSPAQIPPDTMMAIVQNMKNATGHRWAGNRIYVAMPYGSVLQMSLMRKGEEWHLRLFLPGTSVPAHDYKFYADVEGRIPRSILDKVTMS